MALQDTSPRAAHTRLDCFHKILRSPADGVCGTKQNSIGLQYLQCRRDELPEIFLDLKPAARFRLRKSRWIENDRVKRPPLLRQALQPIESVTVNEVVPRRIQPVEDEVAPAPLEVFLRKIKAC